MLFALDFVKNILVQRVACSRTLRRDTLLRPEAVAREISVRYAVAAPIQRRRALSTLTTFAVRLPALMPTPSEHELALQRTLVTRDAVIAFMMGGHPRLRGRLGVQGGRGLCFVGLRRVFVGGGWTVGFEVGLM